MQQFTLSIAHTSVPAFLLWMMYGTRRLIQSHGLSAGALDLAANLPSLGDISVLEDLSDLGSVCLVNVAQSILESRIVHLG